MGDYVALATIEALKKQNHSVQNAKVSILGLTFKENCHGFKKYKSYFYKG